MQYIQVSVIPFIWTWLSTRLRSTFAKNKVSADIPFFIFNPDTGELRALWLDIDSQLCSQVEPTVPTFNYVEIFSVIDVAISGTAFHSQPWDDLTECSLTSSTYISPIWNS